MQTKNPVNPVPSGPDALVRAGDNPEAARPQRSQQLSEATPTKADGDCPQQQLSETTPTAAVDIGGPSPTPERSEGVPPPSFATAHFNPERREGVPPPSPASGPKTDSGKSRSSQNAVTHGLRAKKIDNAVAPELRAAYETLRKQYLDDYKPAGAIESTLLDMVIFAAWQLYKIRDMELFTDLDLGMPGSFGRSEKLARYRGSHERLFFRSLNQLKQIQQERALRETDRNACIPAHLPPAVRLKTLRDHLKRLHRHPKTRTARTTRIPITANAKNGFQNTLPEPQD